MIITEVRNYNDILDENPMTEVWGTVDGLSFQYFLDGTHTIEQAQSLVPPEEATKLAYERNTNKSDKIIIAPDFQIASPPMPKSKQEAKDLLTKYKNKADKGEIKSIGEALQALIYLELNK